jgi:hypothetical protein
VLVYNLYDTEDLYKRFPAGEGQAYFVGRLHASYLRRGDVVLIPIRVGAGLRLGVNAGYMRSPRSSAGCLSEPSSAQNGRRLRAWRHGARYARQLTNRRPTRCSR